MSNLPQQDTIVQYTADGIEPQYNFTYYVPLEGDINVYVTLSGETPVPSADIKILTTDYTVTFNSDITTGGYITFVESQIPPNGATVTLSRDVEASLDVEFSDATTFNGANLDAALDRLLLLIQQNKTLINSDQQRVLSYRINAFEPDSNIAANTQIPVLGVGQIWLGQGTGVIAATLEENPDVSTLRSELADNSPGTDGARLVGYYDVVGDVPTTVQAFLANLPTFIEQTLQLTPAGMMIDYAGNSAPSGWLVCDGSAVSRTTYARLYGAIGTIWGIGDGSTTFNLPDYRRRVSVGSGGSGTLVLGNAVGNTGGEETHTLTIGEMPSHNHTPYSGDGRARNFLNEDVLSAIKIGLGGSTAFDTTTVTNNTGGGAAHNIMQPSAVALRIIKT